MEQAGGRTRIFYVEAEFAEEFFLLPRSAQRMLLLYAMHADEGRIARLTQAEVCDRLCIARFGVQAGFAALLRSGFVSQVGIGRVRVSRKVGSRFHRAAPELVVPELDALERAHADMMAKKRASAREAYHRRAARREQVAIDPADVPDWPRPDA